MATEETEITVNLDTVRALRELNKLEREAERSGMNIGASIRSAVGRGINTVGLGGAIGTGMAVVRGATESGVGAVMGEAFGPMAKQVENFFLGDLNEKARASSVARESTIEAFGMLAGMRNAIPAGAKAHYNSVLAIQTMREKGREMFEESADFHGVKVQDIVDRLINVVVEQVTKGFAALGKTLAKYF